MNLSKSHVAALLENDPCIELSLPAPLQSCLNRHRENLGRLIVSLKSAGIGEAEIQASVSIVIASYEAELVKVIPTMMRHDND